METKQWYLDENGNPHQCTYEEYRKYYKLYESRRMQFARKTQINGAEVSTVFLRSDHGVGGTPVLWETMVFGGKLDGEMDRYTSDDAASEGHKTMCNRVAENN